MVIVFLQSYHICVNLDARSGQGQVNKGLILIFFNLGKQRHVSDAEYPKDSDGAIYFFSMWDSIPKSRVLLYDATISCSVEEINFGFGC